MAKRTDTSAGNDDSAPSAEPTGDAISRAVESTDSTFIVADNEPAVTGTVEAEDGKNVGEPSVTKCECGQFTWGSQDAAELATVDAPGDDGVIRHTPDGCKPVDEIKSAEDFGTDTTGE